MDRSSASQEGRFEAYLDGLIQALGHADRAQPMRDYCIGLMLPIERKSVEPLAAATAPTRVSAKHQSLLHFVGQAPWSDEAMLDKVRELVVPHLERGGEVKAWIVDDTAIPKKGKHSVGVARQYCGQLGKQDNCQVAVTLSLGNDRSSLPIAHRLYLPESWALDGKRRAKAGVPDDVVFKTKPDIALDQIRAACAKDIARGVVLADAAYGNHAAFRAEITALGLAYAVGVQSNMTVWPPGQAPLPPKPRLGRGRPASRLRRDGGHRPMSAKELAFSLPPRAFRTLSWREGTNARLASRFAAVRVRPAFRDSWRRHPHEVEWLLIDWPKGEEAPTKYWLSTMAENTSLKALVDMAKLRWRIERDYQDLKQEIGLGHYEGRSWRGFHHHASLAIAAYGFLVSERETIPPSGARIAKTTPFPPGYRPRGAADPNRTPRAQLARNAASSHRRRPRAQAEMLSVLRQTDHIAD